VQDSDVGAPGTPETSNRTILTRRASGLQKRSKYSLTDSYLRLVAEKARCNGHEIYNCFIEFQTTFNSIKHGFISATFKSYGNEVALLLRPLKKILID